MRALAEKFREFAVRQAAGVSPLYERLALEIADDRALLELANKAREGQPRPNMLFAAVQYLLRREPDDPLACYYDGVLRTPADLSAAPLAFSRFCARHKDEILDVITTRSVQTNEASRAAVLVPAFSELQRNSGSPIQIVDVGCSAGLTMLWPRYRYRYGNRVLAFPGGSNIELECESRGEQLPVQIDPTSFAKPIGLESDPVDLNSPTTCGWLEALCWPEQPDRLRLLRQAVAVARDDPPDILVGDAVRVLPDLIRSIPADPVICLVFCWSIYQIYGTPGGRSRLAEQLSEITADRPIFEVSVGHFGEKVPRVIIGRHFAGTCEHYVAASCDVYGRWISWDRTTLVGSKWRQ